MGEIIARQGITNKERLADAQGRAAPGQEGLPRHPGEAGRPPAHRRGRRDLLPAQHLRQQRAHPPHRGAGRRVLAGRRGRVGLVHQRRGLPPPARGEAPRQQGLAQELPHGPRHAQRRGGPHGGLPATSSSTTATRTSTRSSSTAIPTCPQEGSLGEMVLSTGGAIYLYHQGADGIVDISPFTCMNGIVTEAVYPRVSREHDNIPIRVFYFDGTAQRPRPRRGHLPGAGQDLQAAQEDRRSVA